MQRRTNSTGRTFVNSNCTSAYHIVTPKKQVKTQETESHKTQNGHKQHKKRLETKRFTAYLPPSDGVSRRKRRRLAWQKTASTLPKGRLCKPIRHISHRLQAPAIAHHDRNNAQTSGCQRLTPAHFSTRFSNTDAIIFKTTHSQSVNRNHNESTHAGFVYKCQRHLIRATSPDKITLARQIDEAMSCIIARKDIILHPFYISMTQYKVFRTLQQCNRKRKKTSTGR